MTSIQIPNINYSNGKIQECQLIIDSKAFNILYQNNQYVVSQGSGNEQQKNNASPGNNMNSSTQNTAQSSSSSGNQSSSSSGNQSSSSSGNQSSSSPVSGSNTKTKGIENALAGQFANAKPTNNKKRQRLEKELAGQYASN